MKTIRDCAIGDLAFEQRPGDTASQAHVKLGAGFGVGDEPHLGLGFTPELSGDTGWRVDLEGEFLVGVEQLAEDREPRGVGFSPTEKFGPVMFHQPAEVFARQGAVGDHADPFRAV